MICSPEDALNMFYGSDLENLGIGDFLVRRNAYAHFRLAGRNDCVRTSFGREGRPRPHRPKNSNNSAKPRDTPRRIVLKNLIVPLDATW